MVDLFSFYQFFNFLIFYQEFDTVLFAIGRIPNTKLLNLEKIGVKIHPGSKKVKEISLYFL